MSVSLHTGRTAFVVALVAVVLLLSGCAPASNEGGVDNGGSSENGGTDNGGGQEGNGGDGPVDPEQDRVRTGPVAEYGGPAYGDQGEAEVVAEGVWCKTLQVFWGGSEAVPDGVTFTFTEPVVDQPGLEVTNTACGTSPETGESLASCLGLTIDANATAWCGLEVRPAPDFVEGTGITFIGTIECPTAEVCDAVAARQVDPGPPVVVNTPAGF